jgi:hypothetical protein
MITYHFLLFPVTVKVFDPHTITWSMLKTYGKPPVYLHFSHVVSFAFLSPLYENITVLYKKKFGRQKTKK